MKFDASTAHIGENKMRKIITVLIMLIATAFTVSAEMVRYNVKYQSEYDHQNGKDGRRWEIV